MTKREIKQVMEEIRQGVRYCPPDANIFEFLAPAEGLAFEPGRRVLPKEVVVELVRYQALRLDGQLDQEALAETLELVQRKVVMV